MNHMDQTSSFIPGISESEISESTSTVTPGDIIDGIICKRDESDESTWKDDETLTFTTLTSSYLSTGENSKPKFIKLDKGEMGKNIDLIFFCKLSLILYVCLF